MELLYEFTTGVKCRQIDAEREAAEKRDQTVRRGRWHTYNPRRRAAKGG